MESRLYFYNLKLMKNLFFDIKIIIKLTVNSSIATGGRLQKKPFLSIIICFRLLSMPMQPRAIILVKYRNIRFIFHLEISQIGYEISLLLKHSLVICQN